MFPVSARSLKKLQHHCIADGCYEIKYYVFKKSVPREIAAVHL